MSGRKLESKMCVYQKAYGTHFDEKMGWIQLCNQQVLEKKLEGVLDCFFLIILEVFGFF